MDVQMSKKHFLPFPDNVLKPLNPMKNRYANNLSGPKLLAIW